MRQQKDNYIGDNKINSTFDFSNMNYNWVARGDKVDLIVSCHSKPALNILSKSSRAVKYIFCWIDVHCAILHKFSNK